jgi:FAD/FMN-containing dehydrogenase
VVTARGELITIDAKRYPDLFWAVRGAGQGFPGIVTKWHLALQPRPRQVMTSVYTLPLVRAAETAAWLQETLGERAQALEVIIALAQGAEGQPVATVFVNAFAASSDEARARLAPFAAGALAGEAISKTEATPSSLEQLLADKGNPVSGAAASAAYAVDSIWTAKPADAVAAAAEQMQRAASPMTHAVIALKSGRSLPADAACSRIDRAFVGLYSVWQGSEGNAANLAWLREASQALQPFASGHYINEIDIEANPQKAADCFSPKAWNRLADVRHRYDPERVFHGFLGVA